MKVFILTFTLGIILLYSTLINSNIVAAQTRRNAIDQALHLSLIQTLQETKINDLIDIESEDEMIVDFMKILAQNLNGDGEYEIKIFGIDEENGFLDVMVVNKYYDFNEVSRTVSIWKTVLIDELMEES